MASRPAAGGGRWVEVAPARLAGWLERFVERHGEVRQALGPISVTLTAADGAVAEVAVPFPPLVVQDALPYGGLVEHALAERRLGLLLVRLGGYAVGIAHGDRLVTAKVGSRPVHGRSAAGGWSQQRFARRREGQARVALAAAADAAAVLLLPAADDLDVLVLGGDRRATAAVLDEPRLAPLRTLVTGPHLDVGEPRRRVLEQAVGLARVVRIRILDNEMDPGAPAPGRLLPG